MGRKSREARIDAREKETEKARREYLDGASTPRADGWANFFTGMGVPGMDKRVHSQVTIRKLLYADCEALYRGSDMGARIVDSIPDEMTREGWELACENDAETSEATEQAMEDLEVEPAFNQALKWKRAFGGAGIIIGADDGSPDVAKPLQIERVRSVEWLSVLDCRELVPWTFYLDPFSANYGKPSSYKIMPYNVGIGPGGVAYEERKLPLYAGQWKEIHASRILRFEGVVVNRYQMRETWGWGSSIWDRILDALRDFDSSYSSAASLVQDFSQAVVWIQGLAQAMASNKAELVQQRMQLIQLQRSVIRGVMLDAGDGQGGGREDFERKGTPIAGMSEIMDRLAQRLAAAVDMPITRLMGEQPAGLNATGDNDIRRWYDHIRSLQTKQMLPQLKQLMRIVFAAKEGPTKGKEPDKWSIEFKPMWQLDELQEAQRRDTIAAADSKYITAQVLTPEEVATTRFGGDTYNGNDMNLDTEARAKIAALPPEPPPVPGQEGTGRQGNREQVGQRGASSNTNPIGNTKPKIPEPAK
jgi:phage-related protein (TIGR01555 family)